MTSPREIHRQKKKKSLNFGDFMMPLLGVVLVLLVIFGLKVLFFGDKKNDKVTVSAPPVAQTAPVQPVLPETPQGGIQTQPSAPQTSASAASVALPELPKLDDLPAVTVEAMEVKPLQDVPTYQGGKTASEKVPAVKTSNKATVAKTSEKAAAAQPVVSKTQNAKTVVKAAPAASSAKPVAPKTAAPAQKTPVTPLTSAGKGFSVQAGSFTSAQSANDVVAKMKSAGLSARVERTEVSGRAFFRVLVAGGASREQALAVESKIKTLGKYDTLVVKDK